MRRRTTIDVCESCQGAWFDRNEFEHIVASASRTSASLAEVKDQLQGIQLQRELFDHETPDDARLRCPHCASSMKKILFRLKDSKVVGDQCSACEGLWFDVGEHGSVFVFLQRHLARSRRRRILARVTLTAGGGVRSALLPIGL